MLGQFRAEGYEVDAVMESSGTYGDVLRHQLLDARVPVYRVGGKRTHDAREIYDGVPSLHDAKCAAILAKLHVDGISAPWPVATVDKRNLRAAIDLMDLYQERYLQLVHRLESWLARHWPELPEIVELTSATLLALLGRMGGPAQVAAAPTKARGLMRGMSHQLMDSEKIDRVIDSASRSAGVPMLDLERETLMAIADEAQRSLRAYTTAKTSLEKLSLQTHAQLMAPTVGKTTAAVFATFVGDPSLFGSSAAYVKAFGMNLKEKSSVTCPRFSPTSATESVCPAPLDQSFSFPLDLLTSAATPGWAAASFGADSRERRSGRNRPDRRCFGPCKASQFARRATSRKASSFRESRSSCIVLPQP